MARSALYVAIALVVAAIALATAQASFIYTEKDLASDDSMWALYERWAVHHEVVREHGEKVRRFPIFKNNTRWIRDKYGKKGKSAINIFGDMTYDEFITVASGLRESDQDVQCSGTLDPLVEGREHVLAEAARVKARKGKINSKRTKLSPEEASKVRAAGKAWYQTMISDSDYTVFDVFSKWLGVSQ